ncbi:MAG: polyprenyl synthetase family protein [Elusimicrobiota bacterium]|jgi:geranylgeranyl diphosphate synthase type II|nr:polyprenyl synthetase family protein [Elusimicrobiota bacterium]
MKTFENYLNAQAKKVEEGINKQLKKIKNAPQIIIDAMAYSLNAGGKRVRPFLALETAKAFDLKTNDAMAAACAIEMVHTYSLIHDDLPSMDNDDLRRGKPTNHKVFGEDLSLLAGDGLLTFAFETLAQNGSIKTVGPARTLKAVLSLANYAGVSGMVGGQVSDIFAEGLMEGKSKRAAKLTPLKYFKGKKPAYYLLPSEFKEVSAATILNYIHTNKTGALITTSVEMGALLAGVEGQNLKNIKKYAAAIGFAFQVVDDILDITATKKQLGKSNSDAENKKLTYATLFGLEASRQAAKNALADAQKALGSLKNVKAQNLTNLYAMAEFIVSRSH